MSNRPSFRQRIKSVSLIFACGTALFSDGYANTIIGSVNTILTRIYGRETLQRHNYSTTVNSTGFAGTVFGMILFGWLSDKVGRKFGMMSAATIVLLFSGLSAASSGTHGSVSGLLSMLSVMRFFLGIGVGAEYPCGSVAASEQSEEPNISKNARNRWLGLATICTFVFGFIVASFAPWVLYLIFGPHHLGAVWRTSLGLGMIPAFAVLLWRLNMDEPVRYKEDSMRNAPIPYKLVFRRYWTEMLAISIVWFIFDIIIYPFSIYSSTILNNITGGSRDLKIIFGWNVVIALMYLPGAVVGSFIVDYVGAKRTMIIGSMFQALVGFLMSGLYVALTKHIAAFTVLYGLFFSFAEFGPGLCLFILAAKTCPTAVRGQYFGVSAAIGKAGAFVGIWIFPPMIEAFGGPDSVRGNTGPFWVASGLCVLSAIVTLLFIHELTPEGIIKQDRDFRAYLEANGYDTSLMGLSNQTASEGDEFRLSEDEKTVSEDKKELEGRV